MDETPPPPLVTVLLPVHNGSAHVCAAIESVLAQTFTDFELLVMDDGSTDDTPKILRQFDDPRLRVVRNPANLGLVATLNRGLELARGELVARQDHDDLSHPARLQRQVDYFSRHSECVLLGTEAVQIDGCGRKAFRLMRPADSESIRWYLCFDNAFIHSSVMFRREMVMQQFGGYAPSFHSEDYALWSRLARVCETANLREPLVEYREHGSSITGGMSAVDTAAFDEATASIRWENLRALFGNDARREDAHFLSTYRRHFNAASSAEQFIRTFDRLALERKSGIRDRRLFRQVRGLQLAEIAYRLLPVNRWRAGALFLRAVALDPSVTSKLAWLRIAALFVAGERARNWYVALFGGNSGK